MKILHVTDLHFNKEHFHWVYGVRKAFDAICLSGDLLNDSVRIGEVDISEQIKWVVSWCDTFDTPLFICSGNHDEVIDDHIDIESLFALENGDFEDDSFVDDVVTDCAPWLAEISNPLVTIDNQIRTLSGVTFGCIPYDCDAFERYSACDVILYHVPPAGLEVGSTKSRDIGCPNIRSALDSKVLSPKWVLSGHVHKPMSTLSKIRNTQVSNPGVKRTASPPPHLVITLP